MIGVVIDKGPAAGYEVEISGIARLWFKGFMILFRGQTKCMKNRCGKPSHPVENMELIYNIYFNTLIIQSSKIRHKHFYLEEGWDNLIANSILGDVQSYTHNIFYFWS